MRESRGSTKPKGAMKVKALVGVPRWEAVPPGRRHHRPVLIARRWGGARAYTLGPERR